MVFVSFGEIVSQASFEEDMKASGPEIPKCVNSSAPSRLCLFHAICTVILAFSKARPESS